MKTWLLGIARHAATDALQARASEVPSNSEVSTRLFEKHGGSYELSDPQWTDRQLLRIARSLGAEQREVLALRHVLDLSFAEIAERLGKSTAAARGIDFEARRALRDRSEGATRASATTGGGARHAMVCRPRLSPVLSHRRAFAYV